MKNQDIYYKYGQFIGAVIGGCLTVIFVAFTLWIVFKLFGGF